MQGASNKSSLLTLLILLTLLFIAWQCSFFFIHYQLGSLMDSLAKSPLVNAIYKPFILVPLLTFFFWQFCAYVFFVLWTWFVTQALGKIFILSARGISILGISLWFVNVILLLSLNHHYYPYSFFSKLINFNDAVMYTSTVISITTTLLAFSCFRHYKIAAVLIVVMTMVGGVELYAKYFVAIPKAGLTQRPNIILIGLDSLRPDFINKQYTPNLYNFLKEATTFEQAYTPLARTFPSWISLLTAKFPKHNSARVNQQAQDAILQNEMLGQVLQRAGYFNIYATDEPRFTDIDERFGFDRILGPKGKAQEFLLGTLGDFPIVNLLSNLAIGQYLFPYHYANRAVEYSYEPRNFVQLLKQGLASRPISQPLFFAVHFCMSHWPFTNDDKQHLSKRYEESLNIVDQQFGELLATLTTADLLKHSLVIVFSDHGVTLGLPHDRLLDKKTFIGDKEKLQLIKGYRYSHSNEASINTSYGQGTDVMSLKQYKILLAFKGDGITPGRHQINNLTSTIDIAPTILNILKLPPLKQADGISVFTKNLRPIFLETADTIADLETDKIYIDKLVKNMINVYELNLSTQTLYVNDMAAKLVIKNKERAIIMGDWMLAHYPPQSHLVMGKSSLKRKVDKAYYILANLKTGTWRIEDEVSLSKSPLLMKLRNFYKSELKM